MQQWHAQQLQVQQLWAEESRALLWQRVLELGEYQGRLVLAKQLDEQLVNSNCVNSNSSFKLKITNALSLRSSQ